MEWKYELIFLSILLCLVAPENLFAQNCLTFKYDETGNRVGTIISACDTEYKERTRDMMVGEISEREMMMDGNLAVYPNPSNGVFTIKLDVDDINTEHAGYEVYNNIGVLVKRDELIDETKIDITDNPAGVYLLRILKGDSVFCCVVVKF